MKLRYSADLRTLVFVITYFSLVVAQWVYAPTAWFVAAPLFVATCLFSFFGAVITHNTIHCPVFAKRRINRIFQVVLSLTYGSAVSESTTWKSPQAHSDPKGRDANDEGSAFVEPTQHD